MLRFSPSWIDEILNLPLCRRSKIGSSHLNYRCRSDSACGVQNDRTEQNIGLHTRCGSYIRKQARPQRASTCAAQHQKSQAVLPGGNLQVCLCPSAPCNLDPISQNSSIPEPAVAPGTEGANSASPCEPV